MTFFFNSFLILKRLKRYYHFFKNLIFNPSLLIFIIKNKKVHIGDCILRQCVFKSSGKNNELIIEDGCALVGLNVYMEGNGNKVIIRTCTTMNASKSLPVRLNACENCTIDIGCDCLFSNNIQLHTTDYHSIVDDQGVRTNRPCNIVIGSHVWIGFNAILLKGVCIPDNSVIATGALVCSTINEKNCVIAGVPARVVKHGSNWVRDKL